MMTHQNWDRRKRPSFCIFRPNPAEPLFPLLPYRSGVAGDGRAEELPGGDEDGAADHDGGGDAVEALERPVVHRARGVEHGRSHLRHHAQHGSHLGGRERGCEVKGRGIRSAAQVNASHKAVLLRTRLTGQSDLPFVNSAHFRCP